MLDSPASAPAVYSLTLDLMFAELTEDDKLYQDIAAQAINLDQVEGEWPTNSFVRQVPSSLYPQSDFIEVVRSYSAIQNKDWTKLNNLVEKMGQTAARMSDELRFLPSPLTQIRGKAAKLRTDLAKLLYQLARIHEAARARGWNGKGVSTSALFENAGQYASPDCANRLKAIATLGKIEHLLKSVDPQNADEQWVAGLLDESWRALGEIDEFAVPSYHAFAKSRMDRIKETARAIKRERGWTSASLYWLE